MVKKRAEKPAAKSWESTGSPDELGPAERVAYDILATRRDLFPSIERIMNAGLTEDGTLKAIGLFRDSLGNIGDVHRDPRVAIARSMTPSEAGN